MHDEPNLILNNMIDLSNLPYNLVYLTTVCAKSQLFWRNVKQIMDNPQIIWACLCSLHLVVKLMIRWHVNYFGMH